MINIAKNIALWQGKTPVFTYGTLRLGEINDIHRLKPAPVSLGYATVNGRLYDCGNYPAMKLDKHAKPVLGEVYACDAALIEQLDAIEIHYPTIPSAYQQSTCEVQCGKLHLTCLIYELTAAGMNTPGHLKNEITADELIDWVTYRKQRPLSTQ
jgi:gamma-glutamylcyclotransferase (GGCT)/AIG2-like uncharacterized protein YtfP